MTFTLLYRGPLRSCNYACPYCPMAKTTPSAASLREDREALGRFVEWLAGRRSDRVGVQFTPWGEALIHPWYQAAVATITRLDGVWKVAVQTNLSCPLDWLDQARVDRVGLWCTYHPGQVAAEDFLAQCAVLDRRGVSYSVGAVGLREHFEAVAILRRRLKPEVYLWVNACKSRETCTSRGEIARWTAIDPLFGHSAAAHESAGRPCRCGESVFAVDGIGHVRRCHFVPRVLGNLYRDDLAALSSRDACPNETCRCHIGYAYLGDEPLADRFGDGVLERALSPLPAGQR